MIQESDLNVCITIEAHRKDFSLIFCDFLRYCVNLHTGVNEHGYDEQKLESHLDVRITADTCECAHGTRARRNRHIALGK